MCKFIDLYKEYSNNNIQAKTIDNVTAPVYKKMNHQIGSQGDEDEFLRNIDSLLLDTYHGKRLVDLYTGKTINEGFERRGYSIEFTAIMTTAEALNNSSIDKEIKDCVNNIPEIKNMSFQPYYLSFYVGKGSNFKQSASITVTNKILGFNFTYDLFGIIIHEGIHEGTHKGGHYFTKVKIGDKWYTASDTYISETTIDDVLNNKDMCYMIYKQISKIRK